MSGKAKLRFHAENGEWINLHTFKKENTDFLTTYFNGEMISKIAMLITCCDLDEDKVIQRLKNQIYQK